MRIASLLLGPVLLAPTLLGGCSTASYPSLAQRAGERPDAPSPAPAPAPTGAQAPDALAGQLSAWLADARAADARFAKARPAAVAALDAAKGAPRGSEIWSTASLALAEMERARSDVGMAQASVEAAYAEDRLAHAAEEGPKARQAATMLSATRDAITAISQAQDQALAALRARLPA